MLKQLEGSQGVAQAVALCRPNIVCAYPISPQTHIVEALGRLVRAGKIEDCEYLNVESEFGAMSVAIGAPINIWNDQSDSLSQRDSGWLQLFAEDNQEAVDLHIQAFRIAEELSLPVMVCMDGFVLTHALERMDIPSQEQVDQFLPPYEPRQVLDPEDPVSIGAMVGPEAFTEVRYLAQHRFNTALEVLPRVQEEFAKIFGRRSGGLLSTYRTEDTDIRVIGMGSCIGTIKDSVDELRDEGLNVGVVSLKSFRPFPYDAVREALKGASRVVVIDRTVTPGSRGVLGMEVESALRGTGTAVNTVIAGLGGRAITRHSIKATLKDAAAGKLPDIFFMDLDRELVENQLAREAKTRRSGPAAEEMLKDVGRRSAAQAASK